MTKSGERVPVLGTSLGLGPCLIQAALMKTLPQRMRPYAHASKGGIDELVAVMQDISVVLKTIEHVKEIREPLGGSEPPDMGKNLEYSKMKCFTCGNIGYAPWQKEMWQGKVTMEIMIKRE